MSTIYTNVLTFVDRTSQAYIAANVSAVARAIEPAVVALLGLYVVLWGIASLRGMIEEPITDAAARIAKIAFVLGIALQLMHYNELIVDTFFVSPEVLAAALTGAQDHQSAISSLDRILDNGFTIGKNYYDKGGLFSGDFGLYVIGLIVWGITIAVTAYACFLVVLSKIALAIVLALGPLFIVSLLFQPTASFFNSWIQQLANYALLIVLVSAANIFVISMFSLAAADIALVVGVDRVAAVFPLVITGVISFLVIAQLPGMAAGLAGGLSLSSYGMGRMGLAVLSKTARATGGNALRKFLKPRKEPRNMSHNWGAYENRDRNSIGPG